MLFGKEKEAHELNCKYKTTPCSCPGAKYSWKGYMCEIPDHITGIHNIRRFYGSKIDFEIFNAENNI